MTEPKVTVLIAAYNAGETISAAITSALEQPETAELIVIDDCSNDDTRERAAQSGRSDSRLVVLEQPFNQGPSAARNRGLALAKSPFFTVLDSDDILLPGRFARIFEHTGWDMCADNVRFTRDPNSLREPAAKNRVSNRSCTLDLKTFVAGNISKRGSRRNELGFLKPVIRREFMDRNGLQFDERCRLGEDFVLYGSLLARGAHFTLLETCGYAALERANSLSAAHSITHLRALLIASKQLAEGPSLTEAERKALKQHSRVISEKIAHREILERKRYYGLASAFLAMVKRPTAMRDILHDRILGAPPGNPQRRTLISASAFDRLCE